MQKFVYEYATKVYFGDGAAKEHLAAAVSGYGENVMLAYGGGSVKKNGIYDEVKQILEGAGSFLRIACLAVQLTSVNFLISYTLQAMGKGTQSAVLTFSRQGLLNIPLLILMNITIGLYGMIWTQLVVEIIMLPISFGMYRHTLNRLKKPEKN